MVLIREERKKTYGGSKWKIRGWLYLATQILGSILLSLCIIVVMVAQKKLSVKEHLGTTQKEITF